MSELSIDLIWTRKTPTLEVGKYSNSHDVSFSGDQRLSADAAPDWGGSSDATNPEEALAAALSSCHMMTFLALAAKAQWPVNEFKDHAVAYLGKNTSGMMAISRIDLHPKVQFENGFEIDSATIRKMHERAHRYCFVANSLADFVKVNIIEDEDV